MNASATIHATVILAAALTGATPAAAQSVYHDNVVIVLDGSGSMTGMLRKSRITRMAAAKTALRDVLSRVPESTHVGLLVFSANHQMDAEWAFPLGPRDDTRLVPAIDDVRAGGGTPLGYFIKLGADRLLAERRKQLGYGSFRLLIVTDGEAQDPYNVERYTPEVIARGITVDVIGVDMETRHTLATKVHSYRSGNDPSGLRQAIAEVFAEISTTGDDAADQAAFEEIAGLPDSAATAAIKALARSGNHPIGELPRTREELEPTRSAPVATAPPRVVRSSRHMLDTSSPKAAAYLVAAGVLGVAGVVLFYFGTRAMRTAKLIKDMPTTPIGEIRRSGHVEVKGLIEPVGSALESPYSGVPCVYYEFKVVEGSGRHRRTTVDVRRSTRAVIRDNTGTCDIDLPGARFILDHTVHGSSGMFSDAPPELEERLRRDFGRSSKGWVFNRSMSYTESRIGIGTNVYVLGRARVDRDGGCRISKRDGVFIVSDKPEWDLVATLNFRMTALLVGAAACGMAAAGLIGSILV